MPVRAASSSRTSSTPVRWLLGGLLTLSAALRVCLALDGGQGWWPDESRFEFARTAAHKIAIGHVPGAFRVLFGSADHLAFKILSLPAAAALNAGLPVPWAAVYLGLFSVGSIYLVWRISLLTSGDEKTALWSALFAAVSASLFYYSRQLFPYDAALFFCLWGLAAGIQGRPLRAGLGCSVGFLIYNGYWLVSGLSLLLGVILGSTNQRGFIRQALWGGLGMLIPIAAVLLIGRAVHFDLVKSYVEFSHTVTLGTFEEGWTFPWEYFWKAEGLLLPVWMLGWVLGLSGLLRVRRRYLWIWSGMTLALYFGLGFACVVLHKFVLYGRTVRCLIPFFSLVCGGCAAEFVRGGRRSGWIQAGLAGCIVVLAAPHFYAALDQWYPDKFRARAEQLCAGLPPDPRRRVINTWFYHHPISVAALPLEDVIFARPHPMQYEPFLYENQPVDLRRGYRAQNMTMQLGRLPARALQVHSQAYAGYSGPVRIHLRLELTESVQPIITTGAQGVADGLTLERIGADRFRMGFDHWGGSGVAPVTIHLDEKTTHTIEACLGSLLPPEETFYRAHPECRRLRHKLWVSVDGQTIFNQTANFFPAGVDQVDFGYNLAAMSAFPNFAGTLESVESLPLSAVPR